MAYTKQTWTDAPETTTPLSAVRLGHIEDGLEAAANVADDAAAAAASASDAVASEVTARSDADATLMTMVSAEATTRANADSAEVTARDAAIASAIATLINSAPGAIDTLNELAAALGDDPNFATTITDALALKATTVALDAEVADRANGDIALQSSIDAEITARMTGEGAIESELDAESAARIAADALRAPLASPSLTGVPTAPTAAPGTNSTQIATAAFVAAALAALVNSAPGALDTLKELADALGDDVNFASTITDLIATKVPLDGSGTMTGPLKVDISGDTTAAMSKIILDNGATAKVRVGSTTDTGMVFMANAEYLGGGLWQNDDPDLPSFAWFQHLANRQIEMRVCAAPGGGVRTITWQKPITISSDDAIVRFLNIPQMVAGGNLATEAFVTDAVAGGGSTAGALTDGRPSSPNAEDNEFDSSVGSFVNINSPTSVDVDSGKLRVLMNFNATQQLHGVVIPIATSGAWGYKTKGILNPMDTSSMFFGLRRGGGTAPNAANITTDQTYIMRVAHDGTTNTEKYTSSSARITSEDLMTGQVRAGQPVWWRFESDGAGGFAAEISFDDSIWRWFGGGNTRNFKSMATLLGGAPDSIIMGVIHAGSARPIGASFEFFRRYL